MAIMYTYIFYDLQKQQEMSILAFDQFISRSLRTRLQISMHSSYNFQHSG